MPFVPTTIKGEEEEPRKSGFVPTSAPAGFEEEPITEDHQIDPQPEEPYEGNRYWGSFTSAAKGGVDALAQNITGFKAQYGPDRFIHERFDTGEPEGFAERLKAGAEYRGEKKAREIQKAGQEAAFEGKNYGHDVAGAVGSSLIGMPVGFLAGLVGGPKAGMATASFIESSQEQGYVEAELITEHGMKPSEAHKASQWVFAANLPLNYITDKWLFKALPDKKFVGQLKGATGTKQLAGLIAKRFGASAIQEPAQEMVQETISSKATGKGIPGWKELGYVGLVSLPFGVLGGTAATAPHIQKAIAGDFSPAEVIPAPDYRKAASEVRESAIDEVGAVEAEKIAVELENEAQYEDDLMNMSVEERRNAPIRGVPLSNHVSEYLNGKLTMQEFFDGMPQAVEGQAGGVNDATRAAAKEQIVAEHTEIAAKNAKIKDTNKQTTIPEITTDMINARATLMSLSPELMAQLESQSDIANVQRSQFKDKRRTMYDISNKKRNAAITRNTQRLGEMMELLRGKLEDDLVAVVEPIRAESGVERGSKAEEVLGKVLNLWEYDQSMESFFEYGAGKELLASLDPKEHEKVIDTAMKLESVLKDMKDYRNTMNANFGGNEFEGPKAYFPKVERKVSMLRHPLKRIKQSSEPGRFRPGEDTGGRKVRSARELQRSDSEMESRDWRTWSVLEDYIGDTSRKVAYQPVLSSTDAIKAGMDSEIKQAERSIETANQQLGRINKMAGEGVDVQSKINDINHEVELLTSRIDGFKNTADSMNAVMQASYNNVAYGKFNQQLQELSSATSEKGKKNIRARTATLAIKGAAATKRMFNRAKYKLNIPFIVLRQWTSSGQAWGFEGVGLKDIAWAWKEAFSSVAVDAAGAVSGKELSTKARELNLGTYTGTIKSGTQGRMSREGESGLRRAELGGRSRFSRIVGKMDQLSDVPTGYVEEITGRFSASLANRVADRMTYLENGEEVVGLKGKARNDYISDVTAQMQSEYHHESRAEVLRNPVLNAALPAQSFALEMYQNVTRAGTADKARLVAGMFAANMFFQMANNYRDLEDKEELMMFLWDSAVDVVFTALPWADFITGRGPAGGRSYINTTLEDFGESVRYAKEAKDAYMDGDIDSVEIYAGRAINEVIKNVLPAGGQASRVAMAQVMLRRGLITEEEVQQASILGWWSTPSGKAYLRQLTGMNNPKGDKGDRKTNRAGNRAVNRVQPRRN